MCTELKSSCQLLPYGFLFFLKGAHYESNQIYPLRPHEYTQFRDFCLIEGQIIQRQK